MNVPSGEPKDGDFVAYLAEIERRQIAHLPAPPQAAHELARPHAAPRAAADAAKPVPAAQFGSFLLGIVGLFFLLVGLVGDGGLIATAIGAFLIWHAVRAMSVEFGRAVRELRSQAARRIAEKQKPE